VDSIEFIKAVISLSRADAENLGYSARFQTAGGIVVTWQQLAGARFIAHEDATFMLQETISIARALHGRCSRVLGATQLNNQDSCALKLSNQVITREKEAVLLDLAKDVPGVVQKLGSFVLEKLSEGPRSRLPPNLVSGMRPDLLVEDRELRVLVLVRCMPLYRVVNPWHFLSASISLRS
jgi:hypothetical protein